MDTLHEAVQLATSRQAQRALVNTVLLVSGALSLLGLAGIASALFFQNFVPDQIVTKPIHLQYGSGLNPYGLVSLASPPMKSQQEYDVSVELAMPKSPANLERGNFMISLHLLESKLDSRLVSSARQFASLNDDFGDHKVVFSSRRPTLLPYVDPVISIASRTLFLFYHMFFPSSSTTTMRVPLAERVLFSKGSTIPQSAFIEVEAGQTVQIYHATLSFIAQLRGLRWLMFHYRLPTFLAFTFFFWISEVISMAVAWAIWSYMVGSYAEAGDKDGFGRHAIKDSEDSEGREEDSDRPATFPTYGRQPPLKYEPDVKYEGEEERPLSEVPIAGTEADDEDDEDEDDHPYRDSGIGTSYSEDGRGSVRKRSSRGMRE